LPGISARKENVMERTYESAAALVGRAVGPLASHLGPFVTSLTDQHHTASVICIKVRHALARRLMQQRQASAHTIASYRDTFRLLLQFAQKRLRRAPSTLALEDIDASLVVDFLDELEKVRNVTARTRNLRLTAIHSFFRYVAFEAPANAAQIQRVLAIPAKRFTRALVPFLSRLEVDALLAAPDQRTWSGRRDHAFILLAVQTGLRLSELTGLQRQDVHLGIGAHVRVIGKGRKERCTPLSKNTRTVLAAWMKEPLGVADQPLFPNARGGR
jgi:site-specific recombinase XerD